MVTGAHAWGRAGKHFNEISCSCFGFTLKFKVMPRVKYEHEILIVII